MVRVQELIDKLYQQRLRNEAPLQLLPTVQQLYDALLEAAQKSHLPQSEKVAVVMPTRPRPVVHTQSEESIRPTVVVRPAATLANQAVPREEVPAAPVPPAPAPAAPVVAAASAPEPAPPAPAAPPVREPYSLQKPAPAPVAPPPPAPQPQPAPQPEPVAQAQPEPAPAPQPEPKPQEEPRVQTNLFGVHFDNAEEAPTLLQQEAKQPPKEIHELISEQKESLNDRLKQERTELAHVLKDTPIKDLRKAIGVNDKFQFVNELFRGDEAMYERSIKTINSFHIFPEAEYWINRELKVKLGWNDQSPIARHFYQLVRRRFS